MPLNLSLKLLVLMCNLKALTNKEKYLLIIINILDFENTYDTPLPTVVLPATVSSSKTESIGKCANHD